MKRAPRLTQRERRAARPVPENELFVMTRGGIEVPVPYVACWSSEMPNFRVAPEPLLGGQDALFRGSGRRGEGKPILGKMDPGRQRLCIIRRICQVCARPISGPAWLAMFVEQAEMIDGQRVNIVREPAACTSCMVTAIRVCPGIRYRRPLIAEPERVTLISTLTTAPPGGFGPLDASIPPGRIDDAVVGYIKIVVHAVRASSTPDDFVRAFG